MKVNIVNERHNPFLKRKEIAVRIEHENEPTPTKDALQQYLAKELKTDAGKIEVRGIFTEAGLPESNAKIFAWEEKVVKKAEAKKEKEEKQEKKEQETKQA